MKTLVVYYSVSGNTELLARDVAKLTGGDIEKIEDHKNRSGFFGLFRTGYEAAMNRAVAIDPLKADPAAYDLVIAATPVWASKVSSPVKTFLRQYGQKCKKLAVAVTCSAVDDNIRNVVDRMEKLAGQKAAAALLMSGREAKEGGSVKLEAFVRKLEAAD